MRKIFNCLSTCSYLVLQFNVLWLFQQLTLDSTYLPYLHLSCSASLPQSPPWICAICKLNICAMQQKASGMCRDANPSLPAASTTPLPCSPPDWHKVCAIYHVCACIHIECRMSFCPPRLAQARRGIFAICWSKFQIFYMCTYVYYINILVYVYIFHSISGWGWQQLSCRIMQFYGNS